MKKPAGLVAGGLVCFFRSLWPFTSGHGSPPAIGSRDGGDDRDGGGSASISKLKADCLRCQLQLGVGTENRRGSLCNLRTALLITGCGSALLLKQVEYALVQSIAGVEPG